MMLVEFASFFIPHATTAPTFPDILPASVNFILNQAPTVYKVSLFEITSTPN
jgi:hypothetical protein